MRDVRYVGNELRCGVSNCYRS